MVRVSRPIPIIFHQPAYTFFFSRLRKIIDNTIWFCDKTTIYSVLSFFPDRKETFCIRLIINGLRFIVVSSLLLSARMPLRLRSNRGANGV